MNRDIGKQIRAARALRGITQKELGRRVGISKAQISFWETGTTDIRFGNLERIVRALDMSVVELLSIGAEGSTDPISESALDPEAEIAKAS